MSEVQSVGSLYGGETREAGSSNPVTDPHLSVSETARALRISPATLRRYIHDYAAHIDAIRDGRKLLVAVSSIPALAQIRDLRARKLQKAEIDKILTALPGEISLAGLAMPEPRAGANADKGMETALRELRTDLNKMKRETRDSEVVVRQSLANILFLIDRCTKEIQYHVSEERIAANERDLRIAHQEQEVRELTEDRDTRKGWRSALTSLYRRLAG